MTIAESPLCDASSLADDSFQPWHLVAVAFCMRDARRRHGCCWAARCVSSLVSVSSKGWGTGLSMDGKTKNMQAWLVISLWNSIIFRMIQNDCYVSGRLKPPTSISIALHLTIEVQGLLYNNIFSMPGPDIWGSGALRWDYYEILGLEQTASSSDTWMQRSLLRKSC